MPTLSATPAQSAAQRLSNARRSPVHSAERPQLKPIGLPIADPSD